MRSSTTNTGGGPPRRKAARSSGGCHPVGTSTNQYPHSAICSPQSGGRGTMRGLNPYKITPDPAPGTPSRSRRDSRRPIRRAAQRATAGLNRSQYARAATRYVHASNPGPNRIAEGVKKWGNARVRLIGWHSAQQCGTSSASASSGPAIADEEQTMKSVP